MARWFRFTKSGESKHYQEQLRAAHAPLNTNDIPRGSHFGSGHNIPHQDLTTRPNGGPASQQYRPPSNDGHRNFSHPGGPRQPSPPAGGPPASAGGNPRPPRHQPAGSNTQPYPQPYPQSGQSERKFSFERIDPNAPRPAERHRRRPADGGQHPPRPSETMPPSSGRGHSPSHSLVRMPRSTTDTGPSTFGQIFENDAELRSWAERAAKDEFRSSSGLFSRNRWRRTVGTQAQVVPTGRNSPAPQGSSHERRHGHGPSASTSPSFQHTPTPQNHTPKTLPPLSQHEPRKPNKKATRFHEDLDENKPISAVARGLADAKVYNEKKLSDETKKKLLAMSRVPPRKPVPQRKPVTQVKTGPKTRR